MRVGGQTKMVDLRVNPSSSMVWYDVVWCGCDTSSSFVIVSPRFWFLRSCTALLPVRDDDYFVRLPRHHFQKQHPDDTTHSLAVPALLATMVRGRRKTTTTLLAAAAAAAAASGSSSVGGSGRPSSASTWALHALVAPPRGGADWNDNHHAANDDDNNAPPPPSAKKNASKKRRRKKTSTATAEDQKPANSPENHTASSSSSAFTAPPPPPIVDEILQQEDYYQILGVTKEAVNNNAGDSQSILKKAYRRRALQTHPDKTNGDRRAFDKVAVAYEVLSDDNQRRQYDRYGKAGVGQAGGDDGQTPFPSAEDLFRSFFGGNTNSFFRQAPPPPRRRPRTVRYHLDVSLEELYTGATRTVAVAGPSLYGGGSRKPQQVVVKVTIPRGALAGQPIRLSGAMDWDDENHQGDASPPGDLVFYLQPQRHADFTRKGHDLAVALRISLDEAINGVTRTLQHLDGRSLTIKSSPTVSTKEQQDSQSTLRMIQSGDVQVLKGEGMPKNPQGTEFGDLYVQYEVALPQPKRTTASPLTTAERQTLGRLLRKLEGRPEVKPEEKEMNDVHVLQPARASDFGTASGRPELPREEPDEEEEETHNPFASAFGRGASSFYYHSSSGNGGPFFGMNPEDLFGRSAPDDETAECRQM